MPTGTVAFFHDRKGYGFIETDESDDDIFFHMEDVGGPDVEEGQELEFEITQTDEGPRATNVKRLYDRRERSIDSGLEPGTDESLLRRWERALK